MNNLREYNGLLSILLDSLSLDRPSNHDMGISINNVSIKGGERGQAHSNIGYREKIEF